MEHNKEKQIEKITDVLDTCTYDSELKEQIALALYNADYRKASDVIDEFAERLIQILRKEKRSNYYLKCTINQIANEMKGADN